MHSPEVLAFSIRSPFPSMRRKVNEGSKRWKSPITHVKGLKFRYNPFMTLAGYEFYFDSWVDVWHMEPGGADALTVCKNRITDENGKFVRWSHAWKWHFWHYSVKFSLLYKWRRWLFTRCAECGGASRKGHMVNFSDGGWYGSPKTPLWCGEIQLYHSECFEKMNKRRYESIHQHVKDRCYACVGKDAFKLPKPTEAMRVAKMLFGGK